MSAKQRTSGQQIQDPVERGLTGIVVRPGDPDYDRARMDYNERFDLHPLAIVYCLGTDDVVNAVAWARRNGVPLRARSGGHSYEAYSLVEDGIVVDLSRMMEVSVDPHHKIAVVEAGTPLLPLYEALWRHGMTIPGGSCASVGIAGLTLGGGFGLLARHCGLTCDSLTEIEIVTAEGEVLTASQQEHFDLFWACRGGGGGNFGIVTRLTFALHPIDDVAVYNLAWDWEAIERVTDVWQMWAPGVDERLTCILKLQAQSSGAITSMGQFVGPAGELRTILAPLMELGPRSVSIETIPYIEAVYRFAGISPEHRDWLLHGHDEHKKFKNTSAYAYAPIETAGIDALAEWLAAAPNSAALVQLDNYGGAVSRVADDATAFCHRRGVLFNMQYQTYWTKDEEAGENIAWVTGFRRAMRRFVSDGAYVNYADDDLLSWPNAYYGTNVDRLMAIKSEYDPTNFFSFPQSIPLAPAFLRQSWPADATRR
jgi:FAD/FMN-containing dehydrogenase